MLAVFVVALGSLAEEVRAVSSLVVDNLDYLVLSNPVEDIRAVQA